MPIPKVSVLEKVDSITLQSFKSLTLANFNCFNQWLATAKMEIRPDLHKWKILQLHSNLDISGIMKTRMLPLRLNN